MWRSGLLQLVTILASLLVWGGTTGSVPAAEVPPAKAQKIDFVRDIRPIFEANCYSCHGPDKQKNGFRLDVKAAALRGGEHHAPAIRPGRSAESPLIQFVAGQVKDMQMPPKGERLTAIQIGLLRAWIDQGANWPDGIDTAAVRDKADHWAFKPVIRPAVPATQQKKWARNALDDFVLARLERERLAPSPEADRVTLIRRVYFDLIGLPPAPAEVDAFVHDRSADAYEKLVDRLLASPRYGERWARHWLDIVGFGETHGFEVNTPRENAWPYRDYVIRALNADKPYPEFIRDQLAGDATGEDAATGFIVAKAALLPGQIGRDLESMLLARQDELNDMVLGAGATFLGLTINCARCHDHKFDPISQRDYYAMTAFFTGVRHGERPLRTPDYEERQREAERLKPRLAAIEQQLVAFEPLADPDPAEPRRTSAQLNEENFAPIEAKFVRFTIHDANLHPTLGLLEPCLDELEIFATDHRNVALASAGAKVTASGSITGSDIHRLEHLNDGRYGNSRSWMSDEKGGGWVLVELPALTAIQSIVWSRDREGKFTDRLATAYLIEAGPSLDAMTRVAGQPALRSPVNPRLTVDRFAPVTAKRLRFTVLGSTSLEPCLDELEVFTVGPEPRNVALVSAGAKASASSTLPNSSIHRLEHLNDGRYGNSRSWISAEAGGGWVEIELPKPEVIDRVIWGRDREEKFTDRLATNYTIHVATDAGEWKRVASSKDRRRYVFGEKPRAVYAATGLSADEARRLDRLLAERKAVEGRLKELNRSSMVYAGTFTKPDGAFRLNRGDPMQKREAVAPAALSQIGPKLALPADAAEQERRLALARWIADPRNPLTARVLVNRLWHYHFGEGLVNTPSDFGNNGARPINPELLDWLATEFMDGGWSIKKMQRSMVTSATFRQSSRPRGPALAVDAGSRLLWRFPPRRMEAEVIRDTMLAVCGTLDLRMGGPGYSVFAPNDNYVRVYDPRTDYGPAEWRRMIYQTKVRMAQDSTFGAFDCPDAGQNQPKRPRSTTPLQALNLFNSSFVNQQAGEFARRLKTEAGERPEKQVRLAFRLAFSRLPDKEEERVCRGLVEEHGLAAFCRVMLNANEFVFVN